LWNFTFTKVTERHDRSLHKPFQPAADIAAAQLLCVVKTGPYLIIDLVSDHV